MRLQLFKIPITVHPTYWLFLLYCSLNAKAEPIQMLLVALILTSSLLFHELGHAFAALKFGKTPEITLEAFGGYTSYLGSGLEEKKQFIITLSGPLFTALLIGFSYYLLKSHFFSSYWPNFFCYVSMHLNTYWLIVNLAPLQPLDGGKMTNYLLRKYWGAKGEWFALHLGNLTALAGVSYFFFNGQYAFALIFGYYGLKNFQASRAHTPPRPSSSPFAQLNQAIHLSMEEEFEKAHKIFKKLICSQDEYIRNHALESLAVMLEKQGKEKEAYEILLKKDTPHSSKSYPLFLKLAYSQRHYQTVIQHAGACYELSPSLETALINAKAYANSENQELAQGWLHTARQFEEARQMNWEKILSDPVFAGLAT